MMWCAMVNRTRAAAQRFDGNRDDNQRSAAPVRPYPCLAPSCGNGPARIRKYAKPMPGVKWSRRRLRWSLLVGVRQQIRQLGCYRRRSPVPAQAFELLKGTLAGMGGPLFFSWGSSGRRFKSCQPDFVK